MTERYIGLMSGTSMDAVDAALVDFSNNLPQLLARHSSPMPEELREALRRLAAQRSPHPLDCLGELDQLLGELFADTALGAIAKAGIPASSVTAIGSHGQTLYHKPGGPHPFTLQLADPNRIAEQSGITTVADFRRRDMAAGGQGAPLVPAFHNALFGKAGVARAVLNIGGIANLTLLPARPGDAVRGFDTGPGNCLLDSWIRRERGEPFDRNGEWAASGQPNEALLDRLLTEPYFQQQPPKSTGPEQFNLAWLERHLEGRYDAAEIQATLAELTVRAVAEALQEQMPDCCELILCGGGVHNRHLVARLEAMLDGVTVASSGEYGVDPQWVEAMAFAWLARETLAGRPGNLPAVTGASRPVILGGIYPA